MAVINDYVTHNATSEAVDEGSARLFFGGKLKRIPFNFEVAAADDDGSVYRIGRISPRAIVTGIKMLSDATAGITDVDIGLYKSLDLGGAAIDADCFLDGTNMAGGYAAFTEVLVPTIANFGKMAYEIGGISDPTAYGAFDIAITTNSAASAAGTIAGYIEIIEAE